jgi:hypothetical protein
LPEETERKPKDVTSNLGTLLLRLEGMGFKTRA